MLTNTLRISVPTDAAAEYTPETRVYRMESSGIHTPVGIRDEIERAARAGFNAVLFPVCVNGFTMYPSESAKAAGFYPIAPPYRKWNPVAEAVRVARGLNINFWGFVRPYNFHSRYSAIPHKLLRKFPQWRIAPHPRFKRHRLKARESFVACPINVEYRRYLGDVLTELVSGYPVDGLVLNYTGYSLRRGTMEQYPYCFCASCREVYHEQTGGGDLTQVVFTPDGLERLHKWQTAASAASLDYLRHRLFKSRVSLRLVCRAQPEWRWDIDESSPETRPPNCLDWNKMIDSGSVEELLVDHDDETAPDLFRTRLVTDLASLHDEAFILPAVRVSKPEDLELPLAAIRRYPVAGLLAEFSPPLTDEDAELIRERYLAEPAQSPDNQPLLAVAFFLHRVRVQHQDNPLISDFMRDFLRLIERQRKSGLSFETLQIILENLSGLQSAIRRGRLGDYLIPESTLRDIGLARRIVRLACLNVRS